MRAGRTVLALVGAALAIASTPLASDAGAEVTAGVGAAGRTTAVTTTGAAATDGACSDPLGVTVVIDFQQLGGGVHVRCAAWPVTTGFDALTRAGIAFQTTTRSPGFLCRIAALPSGDPCVVPSPATAYWSYWLASRGGQWCYSNLGAGNRQPPAGTVEGWSFSLSSDGATAPPPGIAVPAAVAGGASSPLGGSDCDTSGPPPSPAPDADGDSSGGSGSGGGGSGAGGGAVAPDGATPAPVAGNGATSGQPGGSDAADPGGPAVPETPTGATPTPTVGDDPSAATTAPPSDVDATATTNGTAPSDAARAGRDTGAESEEAGGMDLRGTSTRGTGSALGVVVAVALIGALGAGAVLIGRRARRD